MAFQHVDPAEKAKLVYATEELAKANKPEGPKAEKMRIFRVTRPSGEQVYTWSTSTWDALRLVAVSDGYVASSLGAVPTAAKVRAMLAALPPEDRAAVVAEMAGGTTEKGGRKGK